MVLDVETIEWLLNTFAPRSSAAKQWITITGSNDGELSIIKIISIIVVIEVDVINYNNGIVQMSSRQRSRLICAP